MQVIRISECGKLLLVESTIRAIFDSGIRNLENLSELCQLFMDISLKFSAAESKKIYEKQFKSLGNQDLLSYLDRLYEFGCVTDGHPSQPEPEKESSRRIKEVKKIIKKT